MGAGAQETLLLCCNAAKCRGNYSVPPEPTECIICQAHTHAHTFTEKPLSLFVCVCVNVDCTLLAHTVALSDRSGAGSAWSHIVFFSPSSSTPPKHVDTTTPPLFLCQAHTGCVSKNLTLRILSVKKKIV